MSLTIYRLMERQLAFCLVNSFVLSTIFGGQRLKLGGGLYYLTT